MFLQHFFMVLYYYIFGGTMNIYDFKIEDINGKIKDFSQYKGKILLIVNTATKCGFTPQYKELQELYDRYREKGFEILDFPCNQFANQAPEDETEIKNFCNSVYNTSFTQFMKVNVNGENEHPLYTYLKKQKPGILSSKIKWNFTKFLIDRNGKVTDRFSPTTPPKNLEKYIKKLI